MASSPAKGAADQLVTASVGTLGALSGWSIIIGQLLDKPDTMIAMYDSPGEAPNPKWLLNFSYIQALVRGPVDGYGDGWSKAKDVQDVLLGMVPKTVNGDHWDGVIGVGDIAFLRYDDHRRPQFSVNFKIFLEPATSSLTQRQVL